MLLLNYLLKIFTFIKKKLKILFQLYKLYVKIIVEERFMLKKLIMSLIGFVVTIVLVVGGTILFVNAKYGINMIDVAKSLKKLGYHVWPLK